MQGVGRADDLLYFKRPRTQQMRCPVNAYNKNFFRRAEQAPSRWRHKQRRQAVQKRGMSIYWSWTDPAQAHIDLYREMLRIRIFDRRMLALQRQGRLALMEIGAPAVPAPRPAADHLGRRPRPINGSVHEHGHPHQGPDQPYEEGQHHHEERAGRQAGQAA